MAKLEVAMFAAGCFWGIEETFRKLDGVKETAVGFAGGNIGNPSYETVSTGSTGHAETVRIKYDPDEISYKDLLDVFWNSHDPTELNRQGWDIGTQYRSVIFYSSPEQEKLAKESKSELEKSGKYKKPIVTEIAPAAEFHAAEEYHQKYLFKRGGSVC